MELRNFSHWHYILTVKGGRVMKAQNVNRRRPVLKFKKLEDIYGPKSPDDDKRPGLVPRITRPKEESEDLSIDYTRVNDETLHELASDITIESQGTTEGVVLESNCNCDDSTRINDETLCELASDRTIENEGKTEGEVLESNSNGDDSTRVNDETQCELTSDRTIESEGTTEGEVPESNFQGDASRKTGELDDFFHGTITLKQIKDRCCPKKRKCSIKEATAFLEQQSQLNSAIKEEECDLMEVLSSLKSRISKVRKAKRKFGKCSVPPSTQNALASAIIKPEEIPFDPIFFQSSGNFPAPFNVKVEVLDIDSCYVCNDNVPLDEAVCGEELGTAFNCVSENGQSIITLEESDTNNDHVLQTSMPTNEPQLCSVNKHLNDYAERYGPNLISECEISSGKSERANVCSFETHRQTFFNNGPTLCVVSKEADEYQEHSNSKSILEARAEEEGEAMMDKIPVKNCQTANGCDLDTKLPTCSSNQQNVCLLDEEPYEYREHSVPKQIVDVRDSDGENMVGTSEAIGDQLSDLSSSKLKKRDSVTDLHPRDDDEVLFPVMDHSSDHSSDTCNSSLSFPSTHEEICEDGSNRQVQLPKISISTVHSSEVNYRCNTRLSKNDPKHEKTHLKASIAISSVDNTSSDWNSHPLSGQTVCLVPGADDSPTPNEKQSPLSARNSAEKKCTAILQSYIHEPMAADDCHPSNLQHPPERLLSGRKAISPTSQKKLRMAMESSEMDDEQYYKYTRKLCYRKLTENKTTKFEGVNQIKRAEATHSSHQLFQKTKDDKNGLHNKGILKDPHLPRSVPRFSTGCTSIHSCTQNAILFSQQQMRDIESIATKLSKELKSMKDIVQETLHSNDPATSLKYSAEEVRTAVHNAARVEENAKRWLSIMSRDCNRFCKIMKLTDKDSAVGNMACKEKRKIVFADEAGGKLCDVKTFKHDSSSFEESNSQKTEEKL